MSATLFNPAGDEEYRRLRGLEAAYDPSTLRMLDGLGVAPGWRCLEVAAGAGSIALALQTRAGTVTVVDSSPVYITHLESPAFVVIEAPIEHAELPPERDLVHARFLLDLVANPLEVLERLMSCLRPGGWLAIEEFDDFTQGAAVGTPSGADLHTKVLGCKQKAWEKRGLDNYLGRKVPVWFSELGLVEIENECGCRVRQGGTPGARLWKQTVVGMRDALLEAGLAGDDLVDYLSLLESRAFFYFSPLVVRTWGKVATA